MTLTKVLLVGIAVSHAQEMLPQHVTVSSMSALGSDGLMHTTMHKVMTQTSKDGTEKRISEVDCKDGACSKSERHFFSSPLMASIVPSGLFTSMPEMPMRFQLPVMHEKMHSMMHHCFHRMHEHAKQMHARMQEAMPERPHFLAPRVIIFRPSNGQELQVSQQFLAPEGAPNAPLHSFAEKFWAAFVVGVCLSSLVAIFTLIIRSCMKKGEARERPLRELGQPLAPDQAEQAELGMAGLRGAVEAVQVPHLPVIKEEEPTKAYLFNIYERAAQKNESKMARAVLEEVYSKVLARVQ